MQYKRHINYVFKVSRYFKENDMLKYFHNLLEIFALFALYFLKRIYFEQPCWRPEVWIFEQWDNLNLCVTYHYTTGVNISTCTLAGDLVLLESTKLGNLIIPVSTSEIYFKFSIPMSPPSAELIQLSAITTRSNKTWYCIHHCSGRESKTRDWIYKRHIISCPQEWAMVCLLWELWRKSTVL